LGDTIAADDSVKVVDVEDTAEDAKVGEVLLSACTLQRALSVRSNILAIFGIINAQFGLSASCPLAVTKPVE
jgi:hypothetical protein